MQNLQKTQFLGKTNTLVKSQSMDSFNEVKSQDINEINEKNKQNAVANNTDTQKMEQLERIKQDLELKEKIQNQIDSKLTMQRLQQKVKSLIKIDEKKIRSQDIMIDPNNHVNKQMAELGQLYTNQQ